MNEADAVDVYPTGADIESDPLQLDPFQEAEQIFNKQMEFLERSFDDQAIGPVGIQTTDSIESEVVESDVMPDEAMPDESFMEEQTLEQIVQEDPFIAPAPEFAEQDMMPSEMMDDMSMPSDISGSTVFDIDPAIDEIHQAMDEVTQQATPREEEPDPFHSLHNPYMMDQFDQMQYMVDPFAMPDPYGPMGPGPMGRMPGPMPGP
jgi:hypothetical protein